MDCTLPAASLIQSVQSECAMRKFHQKEDGFWYDEEDRKWSYEIEPESFGNLWKCQTPDGRRLIVSDSYKPVVYDEPEVKPYDEPQPVSYDEPQPVSYDEPEPQPYDEPYSLKRIENVQEKKRGGNTRYRNLPANIPDDEFRERMAEWGRSLAVSGT